MIIYTQRFNVAAASLDAEGFGHLCKILYTYEHALDIVSLHVSVINLVHRALVFLEDYDCETVGKLCYPKITCSPRC